VKLEAVTARSREIPGRKPVTRDNDDDDDDDDDDDNYVFISKMKNLFGSLGMKNLQIFVLIITSSNDPYFSYEYQCQWCHLIRISNLYSVVK
jgi:hypothetical protein